MGHKRSQRRAQPWSQLDLLDGGHGVGGRLGENPTQPGGGGYLNECTTSKGDQGGQKKSRFFSENLANGENAKAPVDSRETALLDELDSMGLSRVMLRVAHTIGFDNFMRMWGILDASYETLDDTGSGINVRLPRQSAYKRFQRNRFIEALAQMGKSQPEISLTVKRELGEKITDRHVRRLMQQGRVRA